MSRLRYFCVLAKVSSMREAAEMLRISQPALSKAIKKLEDEVGYELTIADGRGILISERGKQLAANIEPLLDKIKTIALNPTDSPTDEKNPLSIGTFEVFSTYFFGALAATFSQNNEKINLHELMPGQLEDSIVSGIVDVGITYLPIPHRELTFSKATQFSMGIYGKKGSFENIAFSNLPFVVPISPLTGNPNKAQGLDGWPDDKISRHIVYRVSLMESALELCRRGLAVAYLPEAIVRLHNLVLTKEFQLEPLPLPRLMKPQLQPVYIVQRKTNSNETAAVKKIARVLREVSGKPSSRS